MACPPSYDDFKTSPASKPLGFSKSHKYNYDNAPYIISSYPQLPKNTSSAGLSHVKLTPHVSIDTPMNNF